MALPSIHEPIHDSDPTTTALMHGLPLRQRLYQYISNAKQKKTRFRNGMRFWGGFIGEEAEFFHIIAPSYVTISHVDGTLIVSSLVVKPRVDVQESTTSISDPTQRLFWIVLNVTDTFTAGLINFFWFWIFLVYEPPPTWGMKPARGPDHVKNKCALLPQG